MKKSITGRNSITDRKRIYVRQTALLFALYLISVSAVLRCGFTYKDDVGRALSGYRQWHQASRYLTDFLSIFVHGGTLTLSDISPLPQMLALLIMAAACMILWRVLSCGKMNAVILAGALVFTVNPYFLECLSFKFDAPYMALSVLCCVIPFLFYEKGTLPYILSSVVCIVLMCLLYQSSSGIYPLLTVMIAAVNWNSGKRTGRESILFCVHAGLGYAAAILFYRFFLIRSVPSYVSVQGFGIRELPSGIYQNLHIFYSVVFSDYRRLWLVLCAAAGILFLAVTVMRTKRGKAASLLLLALSCIFAAALPFGVYLVMQKPEFMPRTMYGFNVLIAVMLLAAGGRIEKSGRIAEKAVKAAAYAVSISLAWCFITFAFTYGNALSEQKDYTQFRAGFLAEDLLTNTDLSGNREVTCLIRGGIGSPAGVERLAEVYPVLKRLIPSTMGENMFGRYNIINGYYGLPVFKEGKKKDFEARQIPIVSDNLWETIRWDGEYLEITLKTAN